MNPGYADEIEGNWESLKVDGNYEINTLPPHRIRKISTGRILAESPDKDGYRIVHLGGGKQYKKHRAVAKQWIDNPEGLPQVDHKNGLKDDNSIGNLRWVSASENNRNRHFRGLQCVCVFCLCRLSKSCCKVNSILLVVWG